MRMSGSDREEVSQVPTLEFINNIRVVAQNSDDDWRQKVLTRLGTVIDLVAAEDHCHRRFYQYINRLDFCLPSEAAYSGHQECPKAMAFQMLYWYLENNKECQYTIAELKSIVCKLSPNESHYSETSLRRKLNDYYGKFITSTEKLLIDMLSSMCMCAPYKEAIKSEGSVTDCTEDPLNNGYVQFAYDNADYNVNTLGEHGTFLAIRGI
ncbi:hypothetical protein PR048_018257 [Dryococelus australis]|uniref:Uncharacterized protein n=1 Tax=Dryococelus australis TaxID=614101 RepID=A0ABQ9HBW7_9NEOP|nr:hypothetical protein PR048_018257 [Dryococelus australis]